MTSQRLLAGRALSLDPLPRDWRPGGRLWLWGYSEISGRFIGARLASGQ